MDFSNHFFFWFSGKHLRNLNNIGGYSDCFPHQHKFDGDLTCIMDGLWILGNNM